MNLPETREILDGYQEIDSKDINWLYHSGYWDGPLSGMVEYNGKEHWVEWIDEEHRPEPDPDEPGEIDIVLVRWYAVLELTPEQYRAERYWHEFFELCVGRHTRYENGERTREKYHGSRASMAFYYAMAKVRKEKLDLSKTKIIGWFER